MSTPEGVRKNINECISRLRSAQDWIRHERKITYGAKAEIESAKTFLDNALADAESQLD